MKLEMMVKVIISFLLAWVLSFSFFLISATVIHNHDRNEMLPIENNSHAITVTAKIIKEFFENSLAEPTAFFTGLLAIFTILLVYVTRKGIKEQSKLTIKAIAQSRETLVLENRAFVFMFEIRALSHEREDTSVWWSFDPIWKNSGSTPTKNLKIRACSYLENSYMPIDFSFIPKDLRAQQTFIGPGHTINGSRITVDGTDLDAVIHGGKFLYFWGWAEYEDIFEDCDCKHHITRFCFLITVLGDPKKPWDTNNRVEFTYHHHPRFNCFDDECFEQDRKPIKSTIYNQPALKQNAQKTA